MYYSESYMKGADINELQSHVAGKRGYTENKGFTTYLLQSRPLHTLRYVLPILEVAFPLSSCADIFDDREALFQDVRKVCTPIYILQSIRSDD
jgi:hypothetical protein